MTRHARDPFRRRGRVGNLSVTALLALLPFVLVNFAAGCGETPPTSTGIQTERAPTTRTYSTDPVDTGLLLRDTSEIIRARIADGSGVHFTSEAFGHIDGAPVSSVGEGDMANAGRVKMKMRYTMFNQSSQMELIAVGGTTYTRPLNGIWQTSGRGFTAPDLESLVNYLDFTRASRNFGQETLGNGRKTYHVQLDVDSTLAMEEAKKRTSDPATQNTLEAMKGAALTVDLWIGWDDQLVYQEKVTVSGAGGTTASESTYIYSRWGQPVDITRPCEAC